MLSIVVGLLTNLVSERAPAILQRLALPAFWVTVFVFLAAVGWQAWQGMAGLTSIGRRSQARRLVEKRQMILLVETAVRRALEDTFVDIPRLPLKVEARPDLVRSPTLLPDVPVGSNTQGRVHVQGIGDIFDGTGRSLLVLGEGGSGKTTLLAELCLHLCQSTDWGGQNLKIPILINLASWREGDASLENWLCRAIADTYLGVGPKLISEWIEDRALMLILDGLDEVPTVKGRGQVLRAVDAFLRSGLCPIVIACRTQEFLTCGTKPALSYAVQLLMPNRRDVVDYLTNLESPVAEAAKKVPQTDQAWWSMISTPMMLAIAARVSASHPQADLVSTGSAKRRRRHIIEVYVDSLLYRRPDHPPHFDPHDARRWLEWLAAWMSRHASAEFYIDRLSPTWIADVTDAAALKLRPKYWLALTWTAAIAVLEVVAFVGGGDISAWLPLIWNGWQVTFFTSWHIRSHHSSPMEPIQPVAKVSGRWLNMIAMVLQAASIGVILAPHPRGSVANVEKTILWMIGAVLVTTPMMIAAIGNPVSIPDQAGLPPGARVQRSQRSAWMAAMLLGLPIALASGIIRGLSSNNMTWGLSFAAPFAVICMASCWLIFGGVPVVQYRAFFRQLAHAGYGPSDYLRFLEWSRERLLLQAVGSAYRFPHREITQYLAESWRKSHRSAHTRRS